MLDSDRLLQDHDANADDMLWRLEWELSDAEWPAPEVGERRKSGATDS